MLRGKYYSYQGNDQAALADFEQALRLKPNDIDALLHRGMLTIPLLAAANCG